MWMDEDGGGGGGAWRLIYQTDRPTTLERPASRRGAHRLSNEQRTEGRTGGLADWRTGGGGGEHWTLDSRFPAFDPQYSICGLLFSTLDPDPDTTRLEHWTQMWLRTHRNGVTHSLTPTSILDTRLSILDFRYSILSPIPRRRLARGGGGGTPLSLPLRLDAFPS